MGRENYILDICLIKCVMWHFNYNMTQRPFLILFFVQPSTAYYCYNEIP